MAEQALLNKKNYSGDSVLMMFANRLKRLRFEKDITQAEFAKVIGVAQQTVGSWEKAILRLIMTRSIKLPAISTSPQIICWDATT